MRSVLVLLAALALNAEPAITYSKYFKGSKPENVIITLQKNGDAVYKESADDDQPLKFQLAEDQARQIFALADKLGRFTRPLESGLKVANMGTKTFRFEENGVKNEVKFNYSLDPDAQALLDWFERIAETEQRYIELDSTAHFDKLGVNEALLQLQVVYERKRLMAPQQFLPLLDRISRNESYLHMARERAANLADAFRGGHAAEAEPGAAAKAQQQ